MLCFPNAKINLGLFVTNKRADGYHDIASVFLPIPIYDILEIVPSDTNSTTIKFYGDTIAGDVQHNLVWKAWEMLEQDFKEHMHAITIHLKKGIPMGAGLGGGSSNGAFMLRLLKAYFKLNISQQELAAYALRLGSDCPFFIQNTTQLARGRGELLSPLNLAVDWENYKLLCVHPEVHISTKEAFGHVVPEAPAFDLEQLPKLPIEQWKHHIHNDFERSFFYVHPQWAAIKEQLYERGAIYVSLTGTGSTIYAIFPKDASEELPCNWPPHRYQWCRQFQVKN